MHDKAWPRWRASGPKTAAYDRGGDDGSPTTPPLVKSQKLLFFGLEMKPAARNPADAMYLRHGPCGRGIEARASTNDRAERFEGDVVLPTAAKPDIASIPRHVRESRSSRARIRRVSLAKRAQSQNPERGSQKQLRCHGPGAQAAPEAAAPPNGHGLTQICRLRLALVSGISAIMELWPSG
jgi:hypothetical protein